MRKQRKSLHIFVGFLILSVIILLFSKFSFFYGVTNFLQSAITPLTRPSFIFFHKDDNSELTKLKNENRMLRVQLVKQKELEKDVAALRDQFVTTRLSSKTLLPAFIIGMPTFLPGVTSVDKIYIDKGNIDHVKIGDKVVFKDNLLGRIEKVSPGLSVVELLNHKDFSETARTLKTDAAGIIKGSGNKNMILSSVSLTDTLQAGDTVITNKDDPLVIGKIISVNKKASSLFQSAEVWSLLDITKLKIVFVLINH